MPSLLSRIVDLLSQAVSLLGELVVQGRGQRPYSADDLLTLAQVVRRIPASDKPTRDWVKACVPPVVLPLADGQRTLYRWGDVLEAMERPRALPKPASPIGSSDRTSDGFDEAPCVAL